MKSPDGRREVLTSHHNEVAMSSPPYGSIVVRGGVAATKGRLSLLVLTDALHLSAGAVWLGGLVGLAVVLPSLAGREREGALVLSRFSTATAPPA